MVICFGAPTSDTRRLAVPTPSRNALVDLVRQDLATLGVDAAALRFFLARGDRRGSTRARCSPARTARSCMRQRTPTGFQALAAAAKLPPIRLHDLQHGAASLMLAAGVPAKVVQENLGHSTITLPSTRTRASTARSRPRPRRLRRRSFRGPALLHTHRTSGASRGPDSPCSNGGAGGARTHDLTDYERTLRHRNRPPPATTVARLTPPGAPGITGSRHFAPRTAPHRSSTS